MDIRDISIATLMTRHRPVDLHSHKRLFNLVRKQKDLQQVFADSGIRKTAEESGDWDIGSIILLDDSVIKALFQPNNHVCVTEFVGGEQDTALWQVAGYWKN